MPWKIAALNITPESASPSSLAGRVASSGGGDAIVPMPANPPPASPFIPIRFCKWHRRRRRSDGFMCPPIRHTRRRGARARRGMSPWRGLRPSPISWPRRAGSIAVMSCPGARSGLFEDGRCMANVAVIGAQWGDEGKGKIVDWLSERADVVVRFQGGHNAGHTLVIGNVEYRLSLLPSGVARPGKLSIIGSGVVVDPWALVKEIENIATKGVKVTPDSLRVAENATLILPSHGQLDRLREEARGTYKIGTTGRGIGPAYEDKVGRRALRLCDLADPATLPTKLDVLLLHHNALLRGLGAPEVEREPLLKSLLEIAPKVLPYADRVWQRLDEARRANKRILFEGAQGVMLDVDHGTYPYVTSSHTHPGEA